MNIDCLETEGRNPATLNLDLLPTREIVASIQREDEKVAAAVKKALPEITAAVDLIAEKLRLGGRVFYFGAGTSGRLGVLDAAECPPTFNTPPELVQALIAGGEEAMFRAVEGAEDDAGSAGKELRNRGLGSKDVAIGLSASGRTPYVMGGLKYAVQIGCPTVAVVCVAEPVIAAAADIVISIPVGPEVLAGSTRMKAGTAQKMVLNMISTATMVKLGKTYGNLMVDVKSSNVKLKARIHRMVQEATGASEQEAAYALTLASGSAKTAIVMLLAGISAKVALPCINEAHGSVRHALLIADAAKAGHCGADCKRE